ncbi:MAG TPA: heme-binding protein, partial [Lacipirellulaceae bacterium]|nr:heme-binding protein [Lacipirellulaceae bacterium]
MRLSRITTFLCLICVSSFCWAKDGKSAASFSFDESATPVSGIKAPKGFKVELLYTVPKESQGSWVNLCADPQGRLIVSDQTGSLYRITVPPPGESGKPKVERVPIKLGQAHGLLCVGDTLYVVVNGDEKEYKNGLYRVRDTNHDDQYDSVELLRRLDGHGEHGQHAVLLGPDHKSLYVVCGDNTPEVKTNRSRVPRIWDEDQLLPRIYGVGFMRGYPAPGGCIYQVSLDGKHWDLVSSGFRNTFDAAFNAEGELFTYDSDMEWDMGAPWYRPTRLCHVVSGADWGWRNGSAKWPPYFADTVPPVVEVGPGSPTGMTFGYGAKFPAKYQKTLFMCDWSYGKLYAVHLVPRGASYGATFEEFITASPLPLTDIIINQHDGAMYFLIGGRGVQSGMYRVTYDGNESTAPANIKTPLTKDQQIRRKLEALHVGDHPDAVNEAWPYLSHPDRFIRSAARTAIEHQPLGDWESRALSERDPEASITALLALVREFPRADRPTGLDLDTPVPTYPAPETARNRLEPMVLAALGRLDWSLLTEDQAIELLRVYELAFYRLGPPSEADRQSIIQRLDAHYPAKRREANVLVTELMCYLQGPSAAEKGIKLLEAAPTQEDQIDIVRSLRLLKTGWTHQTRRQLFEWFTRAGAYKGSANFAMFMTELKNDALARLPKEERAALADVINAPVPQKVTPLSAAPRPFVKKWTMAELRPLVETKLRGRDFDRGRAMFAAANCFGCHRFANEGGAL